MDDDKLEILIIEDDEDDYILLREMLNDIRGKDFEVEWLSNYQEASQVLARDCWDIILVDYDLGSGNGLDLIQKANKQGVKAPLIMITGRGRYELDVEAMNSGAADYLTKDTINPPMLERVIRYSLERSRSREILEQMVEERTLELQNALEELRVTEEELRTQHEELLHANLELAEEGRLSHLTQESLPVVELTTDEKGVIIDANTEAARIFRVNMEALPGKLLSFFIQLEERKRFTRVLVNLSEIVRPRSERFHLLDRSNGSEEWCLTVAPITKGPFRTNEYYWLLHPVREVIPGAQVYLSEGDTTKR
jgi:DNA-binding response OmpR family regulator